MCVIFCHCHRPLNCHACIYTLQIGKVAVLLLLVCILHVMISHNLFIMSLNNLRMYQWSKLFHADVDTVSNGKVSCTANLMGHIENH